MNLANPRQADAAPRRRILLIIPQIPPSSPPFVLDPVVAGLEDFTAADEAT